MLRNKNPLTQEFTPMGLVIIGLDIFGLFIIIGAIVLIYFMVIK